VSTNTYNVQTWLSLMFVAEQISFKSHDEIFERHLNLDYAYCVRLNVKRNAIYVNI
jgi:hypothetical protein